jgi:Rod binding domain-containing protein
VSGLPALAQAAPQEIVAQSLPGQGSNPAGNAEAAKQFEGMLMAFVFQQMRKTVQPSGLFGDNGMARSTYEYMLDQAVTSNAMNAGKGWGISQQLAAQWNAKTGK